VHGEDVKKGKPDPEIYLLAAKKLKYKSSECLVIEDALNGVIAAKKAGCKVIGITTSFSKNILKKSGADYVVNNYRELTKIVKKIQI
jgi:beta-phosphoglucomutase-like phosphatase (HAD superfamily)